jgi:hypothetical protein
MEFTPLEWDVLRWIIDRSDDEALVGQLLDAKPRSRKYTGHGSFTDLRVPANSPKARLRVYSDGLPKVKSPELEHGAGCVLFCVDGKASTLEFYSFAGTFREVLRSWTLEPWPAKSSAILPDAGV